MRYEDLMSAECMTNVVLELLFLAELGLFHSHLIQAFESISILPTLTNVWLRRNFVEGEEMREE